MSGTQHLVQMANDIGHFFRAEDKREDAVAGIANHIRRFWTPRMREKLIAHIAQHGPNGLDELPREALKTIAEHPIVKLEHPPGGDAG